MRNPVHRFEVDLHDPYEEARRNLTQPTGGRTVGWLLTGAALMLGCVVGWQVSQRPAQLATPALLAGEAAPAGSTVGDIFVIEPGNPVGRTNAAPAAPFTAPGPASPFAEAAGATTQALSAKAWPIIVYRAGDGAFYADLMLDDRVITARVDPTAAASSLARRHLPAGVDDTQAAWQAAGLVLEHLRLPAMRFAVSDGAAGESVIGGDLLGRYFSIEEQPDRLRLVPRQPD